MKGEQKMKVCELSLILCSASICDPTPCVLWDAERLEVVTRAGAVEYITASTREWASREVDRVYATRDPENENNFVMVICVK